MAITRVYCTGFESGDRNTELIFIDSPHNDTQITTSEKKSGVYGLQLSKEDFVLLNYQFPSLSQARTSVHFNPDTISGPSNSPNIISFMNGTDHVLNLDYDFNTGDLRIITGSSTVLASAPFTFNAPQWYHIGIDLKIASSGGWFYTYIDGVLVVSFDGNTAQDGTYFSDISLGTTSSISKFNGSYVYYDDFYLDDTTGEAAPSVVPDRRFLYIIPNGNGMYSQFNGSDGNSVDNYLLVDDIPPDGESTYVYHDTSGIKDAYTLSNPTIPSGANVVALHPQVIARKEDGGSSVQIEIGLADGTNEVYSAGQNLQTSYGIVQSHFSTAPDGGAWDSTKVNNVQLAARIFV
ncbi:MAG: hypothetical protein KatS3mg087_1814 [Patescibacteria group bacterium]|nr:MAG: hypothetical protein KatS3mg087_1814 [Patescibacteria group bacterium]